MTESVSERRIIARKRSPLTGASYNIVPHKFMISNMASASSLFWLVSLDPMSPVSVMGSRPREPAIRSKGVSSASTGPVDT